MAEGGQLPWKIQKITQFGPTADYSNLSKPLPPPPSGQEWYQDETSREWRLVSTAPPPPPPVPQKQQQKLGEEEEEEVEWKDGSDQTLALPNEKLEQRKKKDEEAKIARLSQEGITYIKHVILPTDTLSGICLKYKLSPVKLRQVNHFSGSNLSLAPNPLIIPIGNVDLLKSGRITIQDRGSREYKRGVMKAEFPSLRGSEMNAYLDMNDWDLEAAKQNAREDIEWEKSQQKLQQRKKVSHQPIITSPFKKMEKKQKKKKETLTAHVAIPVSDTEVGGKGMKKKGKEDFVMIELSSSVHGKSSTASSSTPPLSSSKGEKNNPVKELFRPLLPRRNC